MFFIFLSNFSSQRTLWFPSLSGGWTIRTLWSWRKSSERTTCYSLSLSTWYFFFFASFISSCFISCAILAQSSILRNWPVLYLLYDIRNAIFMSWWKAGASLFQNLKSGIGAFRYSKLWFTCISVAISIVTLSLVLMIWPLEISVWKYCILTVNVYLSFCLLLYIVRQIRTKISFHNCIEKS